MIDTHCHIYKEYYENIEKIINKAKDSGVKKIIVNGCDRSSNEEVLQLIKKYDIVYGAIGYFPSECEKVNEDDYNFIRDNINNPKIVAIGEIGLDYYHEPINKEKQQEIFLNQLKIAVEYNKPVIIHSRDSISDTYNIVKDIKIPKIIHCYSGSVEMAKKFIQCNCYLGIGGIVTFKNAKTIKKVVEDIPLTKLLLETDSPYLTPEPNRKYKNDPSYLYLVADKIAQIKGIDSNVVKDTTTITALSIFDF